VSQKLQVVVAVDTSVVGSGEVNGVAICFVMVDV
jgi:hypothetical protein